MIVARARTKRQAIRNGHIKMNTKFKDKKYGKLKLVKVRGGYIAMTVKRKQR